MLVVFSSILVADTKITFVYNFLAPLNSPRTIVIGQLFYEFHINAVQGSSRNLEICHVSDLGTYKTNKFYNIHLLFLIQIKYTLKCVLDV